MDVRKYARILAATVLTTAALAVGTQAATASTPEVAVQVAAPEAAAPEVFAGFTDNLPFVGNLVSRKLVVPTGTYTAFAKVTATTDGGSAEVTCRLHTTSAGDVDEGRSSLTSSARSQTMSLQFNTIINVSQDVIALSCQKTGASTGVTLSWMKIVAIRVPDPSHLHNSPLL